MTETSGALRPLVVDLDGTLLRTDLLVESFFALASVAPFRAARSLIALTRGKLALKHAVAAEMMPDVTTMPVNEPLLTWLQGEKEKGRAIYLASASHESYVKEVAEHFGIFNGFFGSNSEINLKGAAKANALVDAFGENGFDYVGNEAADVAIWRKASRVIVTTPDDHFKIWVEQQFPNAVAIPQEAAAKKDYFKAVRPHQWLKNLLIFVPTFAAHEFSPGHLGAALLAFICFSAIASSGYILNDLLDLPSDRAHHRKRFRPFAAGRIALIEGVKLLGGLFTIAVLLSLMLPTAFTLALLLYYLLTLLYSSIIKRKMVLDVIVLALLYSLRLVAGGVAVSVPLSPWLLSFSSFFFLSLALIKRCSELVARQKLGDGDPKGRDYRLSDLPMLEGMAAASGYVAALTSGLYISGSSVSELYTNSGYLWAVPIILLYWISRMLLLMHRGQMVDDPVLFATRDRVSILCGGLIVFVLFLSM